MTEYWDKEIETMPQNKIKELQLKLFNQQLERANKSPAYKGKLPQRISSLDEVKNLPFTCKDDLRQNFPYGFLAVPKEKIARLNTTSGTTGIPTFAYFSDEDLNNICERETRNLKSLNLGHGNILQNTMGLGLSVVGQLICYAVRNLGATLIPIGPGNTERQIQFLKLLKADILYATPSYLQYLLMHMSNKDLTETALKMAITAGEPQTMACRALVEKMGLKLYQTYGMTEFGGPVGGECQFHNGIHIIEDHMYCEIITPDTGELVPDGEYGELVVTPLQQEAMPLIRYRTRDITRFLSGDCPCGRTHRRIEPITHRIDDMMIINGVNVFPSQIEECIYKHLTAATNYLIHIKEKDGLKKLVIDIELPNNQLQSSEGIKKLEYELIQTLKSYITVTPKLNFIPIGTLPEIQGKAKRVVKDIE